MFENLENYKMAGIEKYNYKNIKSVYSSAKINILYVYLICIFLVIYKM